MPHVDNTYLAPSLHVQVHTHANACACLRECMRACKQVCTCVHECMGVCAGGHRCLRASGRTDGRPSICQSMGPCAFVHPCIYLSLHPSVLPFVRLPARPPVRALPTSYTSACTCLHTRQNAHASTTRTRTVHASAHISVHAPAPLSGHVRQQRYKNTMCHGVEVASALAA